jgi:ATP diphosphatase
MERAQRSRRFTATQASSIGRPLAQAGLAAMEEAWVAVKRRER